MAYDRRPATTAATGIAAVDVRGGGARIPACRCFPLWPIATASLRRIGIISVLVAATVLPPHPHLLLPPATTGSVAVDIYWHDQLNRALSLADGALAPMFPLGMGWARGGGERQRQRGSGREEEGSGHQMLPPSTSTSTSTSSATRARATSALVVIIVVVVAVGIVTTSAATAASKCGAVLVVLDAWLKPDVEARPAVEVDAAGHNRLVQHCLEADGAWEPPIVTSQESLLIIAVKVVVIISLQLELSLGSSLLWRPMQIPPPKGGGAASLRSLPLAAASLLRSSYLLAPLSSLGTMMTSFPPSSSAWYNFVCGRNQRGHTSPHTLVTLEVYRHTFWVGMETVLKNCGM
jgi:hypothetical protein